MKKTSISIIDFDLYIEDWLMLRLQMGHQQASVISTRKDVGLFSRYCHEHGINKIMGETIIGFITWVRTERKNHSGAINRKRSSICSYLRHLRLRQVKGAMEFPIEYIPSAREPYTGPIKTLEPEEIQKLLSSIDSSSALGFRDFTLFSLQYALGLRLGEALKINIADVNFKQNLLTVHGKGRRERTLPLVGDLCALIKKWIKFRKSLLNSNTSKALFLSKKGNRLALRTAEENFQKIVKQLGTLSVEHVVPHTLRHAFASHALESESDLLVLKATLGHASMKSTEIYLHPSLRMMLQSMNDHLASDILSELKIKERGVFKIQPSRKLSTA